MGRGDLRQNGGFFVHDAQNEGEYFLEISTNKSVFLLAKWVKIVYNDRA